MMPKFAPNLESLKPAVRTYSFYQGKISDLEADQKACNVSDKDLSEKSIENAAEIRFNRAIIEAELACAKKQVAYVEASMDVLREACGDETADLYWDMYQNHKTLDQVAKESFWSRRQMMRIHVQTNEKYSQKVNEREVRTWMRA